MRHVLAAFASGALVSGALYGILNAVAHPQAEPEDPWLDAWKAAGLRGQFVTVSMEPDKHLMFGDARELFKGREYEDTVLRRYLIQNVGVQVVVFPRADSAKNLPEGRHAGFRLKAKGPSVHLCRSGRNVLLVKPTTHGIVIFGDMPTPKAFFDGLCDVFEETAANFP